MSGFSPLTLAAALEQIERLLETFNEKGSRRYIVFDEAERFLRRHRRTSVQPSTAAKEP